MNKNVLIILALALATWLVLRHLAGQGKVSFLPGASSEPSGGGGGMRNNLAINKGSQSGFALPQWATQIGGGNIAGAAVKILTKAAKGIAGLFGKNAAEKQAANIQGNWDTAGKDLPKFETNASDFGGFNFQSLQSVTDLGPAVGIDTSSYSDLGGLGAGSADFSTFGGVGSPGVSGGFDFSSTDFSTFA